MKIPNKFPPWFNDEYLHLRKELESKKSKAHRTRSEQDWGAYKTTRNRVNNLATKLKKEYLKTSIREAGTISRKLWKTIKTVIPSSQHKPINSLKVNYKIETKGKLIANEFNSFFSNIGKKLADAIQVDPLLENHSYGDEAPESRQFHFSIISEEVVSKLLRNLDGGKATGLDNISPKLLKVGYEHLAKPLAYNIMNLSLATGAVPTAWKVSRVSPIFKEGDPLDTSNYRPISVIPVCMKVFEKKCAYPVIQFHWLQ